MKEDNDQMYDLLNQRFQPLAIIQLECDLLPSKIAQLKKHKTKKAGKKKQGTKRKG
jgi:hypothetical protein